MALADIGLPELARAVLELARPCWREPQADAHLDALTSGRRARRQAGVSISLGPWDGTADGQELERLGLRPMTPDLATAALRHAVEHDETQLTAATIDWERFVPVLASRRPSPLLSELYEDRGRQAGELVRGETAVVPGMTRRTSSEPTATSWTSACRPSPRLS